MMANDIHRVWRGHRAAQESYDRLSRWYDLLEGGWEDSGRKAGLKLLALQAGEPVLEIGPGTGKSAVELAAVSGSYTGLDLSVKMLYVARQRLAQAGQQKAAVLVEGDGTRLPFKDRSYTAIFMSFVLELFDTPEIPLVLAECRRMLRPQGRLCLATMDKTCGLRWANGLYERLHDWMPNVLDCRPIIVRRALEEAGFTIDAVQSYSLWGLGVAVVLARPGD
jgi:ubiquinone/menaquinone biosynthesis C-methylase UbiE